MSNIDAGFAIAGADARKCLNTTSVPAFRMDIPFANA
jgi:hypothetical protein